jgi:hypothetical protein
MSAPSARDDVVAAPYTGKRLRKLRFLMTDNMKEALPRVAPRFLYRNVVPDSAYGMAFW